MPQEYFKSHSSGSSGLICLSTGAAIATLALSGLFSQAGLAAPDLPPVQPNTPSSPDRLPTSATPTPPQAVTATQPRFSCQWTSGQYTVMYHPESRPRESFPWATPSALGGGWTPERRCNEISRRLEEYRPDGLQEMQTTQQNNYNVVCITAQRNSTCRIVFTVPPGQDPTTTRDRVFQNLNVADKGQATQSVNTFAAGKDSLGQLVDQGLAALRGLNGAPEQRDSINLLPFLDVADGGTGTALKQGIPRRLNPQLNPDRFR